MALDDDIRTLSGVALFQSLADDHLRLLAFGAERVKLPAGQRLYREGDIADSAFVVTDGRIGLYHNRDGRLEMVGRAEVGEIVSELALIAETQRLTEAVALSDSQLLRLDRKSFKRILDEYPEIAAPLYDRIADDLQAMVARLERLSPHFEN
ncbi:MAG: cyclic nucleotide-binding domain-containing protein [Rhizobiaceae bacterium]